MKLSFVYRYLPQLFMGIIIVLISLIFVVVKQNNELKDKLSSDDIEDDYVPKKDFKQYCDTVTRKVAEVVDDNFNNAKSNIAEMFSNQPRALSSDEIESIIDKRVKKIIKQENKKSSNLTKDDISDIVVSELEIYNDNVINDAFSDVVTENELSESLENYINISDYNENINTTKDNFQKIQKELQNIRNDISEISSEVYGNDEEYGLNERMDEIESNFQVMATKIYDVLKTKTLESNT